MTNQVLLPAHRAARLVLGRHVKLATATCQMFLIQVILVMLEEEIQAGAFVKQTTLGINVNFCAHSTMERTVTTMEIALTTERANVMLVLGERRVNWSVYLLSMVCVVGLSAGFATKASAIAAVGDMLELGALWTVCVGTSAMVNHLVDALRMKHVFVMRTGTGLPVKIVKVAFAVSAAI